MNHLKVKADNKFDFLIVFLISLLVFGDVGGALQPVRFFAIFIFPLFLLRFASINICARDKNILFFFYFWLFFSVLSLFWSINQAEGLRQIIYYLIHFILFFQLVVFSNKANNAKEAVISGWLYVLFLTLPIAIWEIVTNNHLSIALDSSLFPYRHASVTFGNPNAYIVVVLFALPFLLSEMLRQNGVYFSVVLWVLLLASGLVLVVNSSRGGILALFIYLFIFALFGVSKSKVTGKNIFKFFSFVFFFGFLTCFLVLGSDDFFARFFDRLSLGVSSFFSDPARLGIYISSIEILFETSFFGFGIGSEVDALKHRGVAAHNSHNLFLEIIIQFGVFVFAGFLIFLVKIFVPVFHLRDKRSKFVLMASFFAFLPVTVINSSYLLMPSFWLFLSSLLIVSSVREDSKMNHA
ncbi:O-antigen ligase family protein [Stutzerimonas nitrititolerans]|uniref:O-antigen ligase family protein n=1 Tax=Stutzerimonas nitrititolerans TaxID=2482751 RepID=UPI002896704C|nr:O-antigen ligase family protein [Stutzerimonas nitrititolerans]